MKRIGHLDDLTLEDFLKYFSNDGYDERRKKAVEELFKLMDLNKNGKVCSHELMYGLL